MRILLLVLLLPLSACWLNPPTEKLPSEAGRPRISVQFFLVLETVGADIVERKVESTGEVLLLEKKPDLTERDIAWARMETVRGTGRPSVLIHLTPLGRDKLDMLTRQNIGKRLAIVVDGRILSTPLIRGTISDGRASIQGFKSAAEAQRVADALAWR